jgi:hypothetical protein
MTKSFKKFREEWEEDEWGENDDRGYRRKERQMENRKERRKEKLKSRWDDVEDADERPGKKFK